MRIIVINNSGNVGKSTICQQMLLPRLGYDVLRVETLNTDGEATGEKLSAEDFDKIFNKILSSEDVIVDIGSSNISIFKTKIETDFEGAHNFIDYFLIPVTPDEKQQLDTVATICDLDAQGIQHEKIKLIFNRVNPKKDMTDQFSVLYNSEQLQIINYNIEGSIPSIADSSLFKSLERAKLAYNTVKDYPSISEFNELISEKTGKEKTELELKKFYKLGFDAYQKQMQVAFDTLNLK